MNRRYNNDTSLTNDKKTKLQEVKDNQRYSQYNTSKVRPPISAQTFEPGVIRGPTYDGYINNVSSDMNFRNGRNGNILTHDKSKKQLKAMNVMGTTGQNISDKIIPRYEGRSVHDRSSLRNLDRFEPLIPSLKAEIQNPEHYIPQFWIRGGMDTRAAVRNIDYYKAYGLK